MKHINHFTPEAKAKVAARFETHGTAWTEPGQGATVPELRAALMSDYYSPNRTAAKTHEDFSETMFTLDDRIFAGEDDSHRTNLALTGHPLTADDLKRIAECR